MDIAADHGVGVVQDRLHPVGEHDLRLGAHGLDQLLIVGHVIHAGEGVDHLAEGGAELLEVQHVVPRVDARLIQLIQAHQMVAHLVGGVGQHQHHLLAAPGDALEQQGEAVAAEDGEGDAHGPAAGLDPDVGGDLGNGGVVALAAGHDGLGHSHHVLVAGLDAVAVQRGQHGVHNAGDDVVALPEDGRADTTCHGADQSAHENISFISYQQFVITHPSGTGPTSQLYRKSAISTIPVFDKIH